MNKLKEMILGNAWLTDFIYRIMTCPTRIKAAFALLKREKITCEKRKVVIIVQLPAIWNKIETVYNELANRDAFEVILFAIPDYDFAKENPIYEKMDNKAYVFLKEKGLACIKANTEHGWFDLKSLKPEYVFHPRPYNTYLPEPYKTNELSKYTKVCYISYAYLYGDRLIRGSLNVDFFKDVTLFFAENEFIKKWNVSHFRFSHLFNIRKSYNVGYPPLESVLKCKDQSNIYWDKKENSFKVMWTPRWTADERYGKSNFFLYKDDIVEYAKKLEEVRLVFRPHPLTFGNFIKNKLITKEELDTYLLNYDGKKMILDETGDYLTTFWNSDVLVCDYSSILIEYMITGKPVIYCDSSFDGNYILDRMMEGFYVVKTFEEMKKHLENLRNGIDPLREKREEIVRELINIDMMSKASQNICDILVNNKD